jgi:Na(+)-translocating NADH:ubiquinone oxidoreductase A subunit
MKLRGGYDIVLAGRPKSWVEVLPEPEALYLPLRSQRFTFSQTVVEEDARVRPGEVLAVDPDNYSVPLLAPRAGTVRLGAADGHIVLEEVAAEPAGAPDAREDAPHAPKQMPPGGEKRQKLLTLGAWQFLYDAHAKSLPDPFSTPRAVIVSTLHLEPFFARGDAQLQKRLVSFVRGLEHVQSLLEYQPIFLVLPEIDVELERQVRAEIRGYAWVKPVRIRPRYPHDDFALLARMLGLSRRPGEPVWALRTEGVLAIDRALTLSQPCTVRIVSLGGPPVAEPVHLKAMPGYPLRSILDGRIGDGPVRVLNGGALTGQTLGQEALGLDAECMALTVLPDGGPREFLGFARPGWDRRSYHGSFLSALRKPFPEPLTTEFRGERRACVACCVCEEVCPAGIWPHLIHKHLYRDDLEEAEAARLDLCVECGLCSYVCPSKIDLLEQFIAAKQAIKEELEIEEQQKEKDDQAASTEAPA